MSNECKFTSNRETCPKKTTNRIKTSKTRQSPRKTNVEQITVTTARTCSRKRNSQIPNTWGGRQVSQHKKPRRHHGGAKKPRTVNGTGGLNLNMRKEVHKKGKPHGKRYAWGGPSTTNLGEGDYIVPGDGKKETEKGKKL